MKKSRIILPIALVVAAIAIGFAVKTYADLQVYRQQVAEIEITNVDLSKVSDGTYKGSCGVLLVEAEVKVDVKDHKIANIELVKHKNGKGQPAEVIPGRVVEAQSLEVDIVSGATSSSKVILKAIENALRSGE